MQSVTSDMATRPTFVMFNIIVINAVKYHNDAISNGV